MVTDGGQTRRRNDESASRRRRASRSETVWQGTVAPNREDTGRRVQRAYYTRFAARCYGSVEVQRNRSTLFLARAYVLSTVHLSVTWVDQSKTVEVRIMKFSPLVFAG